MIEPVEKEIDGRTYIVSPLPATKGLAVLTRIIKVVGPSIGEIGDIETVMSSDLTLVLKGLSERLDETVVSGVVSDLLSTVQVRADGRYTELARIIDTEFAGRIGRMLRLLGVCLEVNFGDFFGAGGLQSSIMKRNG